MPKYLGCESGKSSTKLVVMSKIPHSALRQHKREGFLPPMRQDVGWRKGRVKDVGGRKRIGGTLVGAIGAKRKP